MCSDCGTNPPLTLVCKSEYEAAEFVGAIAVRGGNLRNSRMEIVPAARDGAAVTIPWNGDPIVMAQFGQMAAVLGFAEVEECYAMTDRANAAMTGIPVAVLQALRGGTEFIDAIRPLTAEPPKDKVSEMIQTLVAVLDDSSEVTFVPGDLLD